MTLVIIIPDILDKTKILVLLELIDNYSPEILLCTPLMYGNLTKILKLIKYEENLLIKDYKFKIQQHHNLLFYLPYDDIKIHTKLLTQFEKYFLTNKVDILAPNIKFLLCQSKVLSYNEKFWLNINKIFKQKYKKNKITYDYMWSNNIKPSPKKDNILTKDDKDKLFDMSQLPISFEI